MKHQTVTYNEQKSKMKESQFSPDIGEILDLLVFLLCTNTLALVYNLFMLILFTDDINHFVTDLIFMTL